MSIDGYGAGLDLALNQPLGGILGRNLFGPIRGPWPDKTCKGWWGDNPPHHDADRQPCWLPI
jgi:hypothetical protein